MVLAISCCSHFCICAGLSPLGGLGGIAAGARAGYQAKGAAQSQSKQVKDITTQVLQKWAAYNQNIKTSTGEDAKPEIPSGEEVQGKSKGGYVKKPYRMHSGKF